MANLDDLVRELTTNSKVLTNLNTSIKGLSSGNKKGQKTSKDSNDVSRSLFDIATEVVAILYPINEALQFQIKYSSSGLKAQDVVANRLAIQTNRMTSLEGGIDLLIAGLENTGGGLELLTFRAKVLGENVHELLSDFRDYSNNLGKTNKGIDRFSNSIVSTAEVYRVSTGALIEAMASLGSTLASIQLSTGGKVTRTEDELVRIMGLAGRRSINDAKNILSTLFQPGSGGFKMAGMFGYEDMFRKLSNQTVTKADIIDMLEKVSGGSKFMAKGMDPRVIPEMLQNMGGLDVTMVGQIDTLLEQLNHNTSNLYDQQDMIDKLNTTMYSLRDQSLAFFATVAEVITKISDALPAGVLAGILRATIASVSVLTSMYALQKITQSIRQGMGSSLSLMGIAVAALVGVAYSIYEANKDQATEAKKANMRAETRQINTNPYSISQSVLAEMLRMKYEKDIAISDSRYNQQLMEEQNKRLEEISRFLANINSKTSSGGGLVK